VDNGINNNEEKTKRAKTEVQRTRNNEDLRQQRKAQYIEGKGRYASTIEIEKSVHGKNTAT
jgi:hypothetical protein